VVISPGSERLALRQRDTLLALEACVDRLAAHVADLQALLRRARRHADRAIVQVAGESSDPVARLLPHTVGDRRRALGLSQRTAARATGYSRSEISELERGTRRSPGALEHYASTLERLEHEARWRRTGLARSLRSGSQPAAPTEGLS
jgi:hypothetical protein